MKRGGRTYLAEVENRRIGGKVVQRHVRYVGRQADDRVVLASSISDASVESVKLYGPLIVLDHLAKEIGLGDILGEHGDEILSLAYAHCIDYKSVNQMSRWFERTDLSFILDLEKLTEARLLSALDSLEKRDHTELQREIFDSVSAKYKLDSKGVVYDVTNTYLYGKKCSLGRLGKGKDGFKGRPLIQIGLGTTQRDGVPVFHKVHDGNTHDSRTFLDAVSSFEQYGFKEGLVVFDREISSEPNQKEIDRMGWKVLCGLPLTSTLKRIARGVAGGRDFASYKNRVKLDGGVFYCVAMPYRLADIQGRIAVCYNEQRKREVKESRYDEIANAETLLRRGKRIKSGLEKYFDKKGHLLPGKLREAEEMDGYSVIFTTAELDVEQMVELYFAKYLVEKAFHCLKGIVKVRPVRHWLYNRVVAHVFICYLAYLLLSLLRLRLKPIGMSPVECLAELNSLYKVYIKDERKGFRLSKIVALSKRQEEILKTIDKKLMKLV